MWNWDYEKEREDLRKQKKEDSYHFSVPFEYIRKKYGDDDYDIADSIMEVDVCWNESEAGYNISYYCTDVNNFDPAQGSVDETYTGMIESTVMELLYDEWIPCTLVIQ